MTTGQRRAAAMRRLCAGLACIPLLTAPCAVGEEPAAPPDLNKLVGQPVEGHANLVWKRAEVLLEWGFTKETEALPFDGSLEATQVALVGAAKPLPGDSKTAMAGERSWKSPGDKGVRRGIVVPILYTLAKRGPARSIVTVRTLSGSFSFQPVDLRNGPMFVNELGFFIWDQAPKPSQAPVVPQILPAEELLQEKLNGGEGNHHTEGVGRHGDGDGGVLIGG